VGVDEDAVAVDQQGVHAEGGVGRRGHAILICVVAPQAGGVARAAMLGSSLCGAVGGWAVAVGGGVAEDGGRGPRNVPLFPDHKHDGYRSTCLLVRRMYAAVGVTCEAAATRLAGPTRG